MTRVKIFFYKIESAYYGDPDDWANRLDVIFSNQAVDWEEISEDDLNLLRDNIAYIPAPKGFRTMVAIQDGLPISTRISTVLAEVVAKRREAAIKQKKYEAERAKQEEARKAKQLKRKQKQLAKLQAELGQKVEDK